MWHGYSGDRLTFARLELKDDDTGLLAVSYLPGSPPSTYRVTRWSQQRFKLDIKVEPAEPEAEPISLQNVTHGIGSLELELRGKGWSRKMALFDDGEFQRRANATKKSLENLRKSK